MVVMFINFPEQAMKLTTKQLKQIIKEELSHVVQESNSFTEKFEALFSGDAELIMQGLTLAHSLGMTPEDLPFDKLDLNLKITYFLYYQICHPQSFRLKLFDSVLQTDNNFQQQSYLHLKKHLAPN